jgi:ribonuclease HII
VTWIVGVDEAGYGPNLGPLVMTAVACRAPDALAGGDLWQSLTAAVRRGGDEADARLVIDDSKRVYSAGSGLHGLERGVLSVLWPGCGRSSLAGLLQFACPDAAAELRREPWFTGATPLPLHAGEDDLSAAADSFQKACADGGVGGWAVRSVTVCAERFNAVLDRHDSKGAVLAHSLAGLLRWALLSLPRPDDIAFFIDKHGGRNAYAAQVQHALPETMVVARQESLHRSCYQVLGLCRSVSLTFQPRADAEHFCVALASMASKYLRELLMKEFNRFWQEQVPGLKATAGYPTDAARFLGAILPAARRLGIAETALWRRK